MIHNRRRRPTAITRLIGRICNAEGVRPKLDLGIVPLITCRESA